MKIIFCNDTGECPTTCKQCEGEGWFYSCEFSLESATIAHEAERLISRYWDICDILDIIEEELG